MDEPSDLADHILDQVADAVIFADQSGRVARWNRASAALFGFCAAEALGQSLDLIVPGHLRTAHWRGFDDAMANGVLKLQGRPTYLNGDKIRAIKTVTGGLETKLTVNGHEFNGVMPAWSLSDEDIADVLTYVYSNWGNSGQEVTPAEVKAYRIKAQ